MTRQRFVHTASAAAALGGAAWVTKVAVLAATDGGDSVVASSLYLAGVFLMLLGSTWVGVRLAGRRRLAVAVAFGALSPLLVLVSYGLIDPVAKAAAGSGWFEDEAGILVTGLLWLAASLPAWLAQTTASPTRSVRSTT